MVIVEPVDSSTDAEAGTPDGVATDTADASGTSGESMS